MGNTLTLKKLVLRDKKAYVMLSPKLYGDRGSVPEDDMKAGLAYKWTNLKTGREETTDYKHPYILVWLARHNGFDYRMAVSYNYLVQHFNIDLSEDAFANKMRERVGYLDQPTPSFIEKVDEEYFGMRIPLGDTTFEFNGKPFACNRNYNNGMGDWILFPAVNGKPDLTRPEIVDGVDIDSFYTALARFSYIVDVKSGDIVKTLAEARTYDT